MFVTIFLLIAASQTYVSAAPNESNCNAIKTHPKFHLLVSGAQCRRVRSAPRIMGGKNALLGEFPWEVVIYFDMASINVTMMWCTGSVISNKYVLTAAHCMNEETMTSGKLLLTVGEHDLRTELDCDGTVCAPLPITYEVEKYIPHPQYDKTTNYNDLGLFKVKGEIQWSDYVYPACLPTTCAIMEMNFVGVPLTVAGFGALEDIPEKLYPNVLQKLSLVGTNPDVCSNSYEKEITEKQICVGGSEVGYNDKDACHGDSGGPLMYRSSQDGPPTLYLVGVVSSGEDCLMGRSSLAPGIYVRVASYMDWILDTIEE